MPAPIVPVGLAVGRLVAKHGLPAVQKAMKTQKTKSATKKQVDSYNSPASQAQRAKESLTRNPQALKTKTAAQMTPKQKSAAMAKEQAKANKNRLAFEKKKTSAKPKGR
jgi:uncharacterized membrane-anchored protein YhcB (DUF1043 family)